MNTPTAVTAGRPFYSVGALTLPQLERHLFAAGDILRGKMVMPRSSVQCPWVSTRFNSTHESLPKRIIRSSPDVRPRSFMSRAA